MWRFSSQATGQQSVVSGQWSAVSGQWSAVSGQQSLVSGQWSVVREQSPNLNVSLIVLRHIVVQAEQEGETKEKSKASKKEKN